MQMILNDAEVKEYLRLKAIFDSDANLDLFEKRLKYFYYTQLIPIHERVDLERYPDTPKATEEELEKRLKCAVEALLDIVSTLRGALKLHRTTLPTDI